MSRLINPIVFSNNSNFQRGTLKEIHISDIHFGVIDPKMHYSILEEQFISKIEYINFDILSINGDLFEHKYMSNSDVVMYAVKFIDRLVNICRNNNATFILIHGTMFHDANQLKLFYHYLTDPSIDIRIVEDVKFEYVKGAKILCIPELYNKGDDYYNEFLINSGEYDSIFMHGTFKGSVFGANKEDLNTAKSPVFSIENFKLCRGPMIAGHVHRPGCFSTYFYYCGSPIRYKFGEEEDKGFIILLHNLDTHEHYVHFETIESFRYDTINLDHMIMYDPKDIIAHLKQLQASGIDNIKVEFSLDNEENLNIIKNYYKNNSNIKINTENKIKTETIKNTEEVLEKYKEYNYILDPKLSEYDILVRYINDNKGFEYITVKELMKILEEE